MHPAPSIIVFSTLSGLGLGLVALLSLGALAPGSAAWLTGAALALGLTSAGLLASLLHLGHPERAWRALSQWRSSWLSREGVLSVATLGGFALLVLLALAGTSPLALGLAVAGLAAATVHATAMIYASLRSVPAWNRALTPACYLAFAAAGGGLLAACLAAIARAPQAPALAALALALLALAWGLKALWWRGAAGAVGPSTPESATGLGGIGRVRLFEAPHTSPNYLMKEMVFVVGRRRAIALRRLAVGLGGLMPMALLGLALLAGGAWPLLALAAASHALGMLAERWLFFAEARHAVGLYYGQGRPR